MNIPVSKKEVLDGGKDILYENDELDYDWAPNHENEILFLDKLNNGQSNSDEQCWLFQPEYNDIVDTNFVSYEEHINQLTETHDEFDDLGTFYLDDNDSIASLDLSYEMYDV